MLAVLWAYVLAVGSRGVSCVFLFWGGGFGVFVGFFGGVLLCGGLGGGFVGSFVVFGGIVVAVCECSALLFLFDLYGVAVFGVLRLRW